MTAPFVASLRTRPETIRLVSGVEGRDRQGAAQGDGSAAATEGTIVVRVEVPDRWDVVRVEAVPSERVQAVKVAALSVIDPKADQRNYVTKLRGFEVLDEGATLADAGAVDGSIFVVTHRRRRPVR